MGDSTGEGTVDGVVVVGVDFGDSLGLGVGIGDGTLGVDGVRAGVCGDAMCDGSAASELPGRITRYIARAAANAETRAVTIRRYGLSEPFRGRTPSCSPLPEYGACSFMARC